MDACHYAFVQTHTTCPTRSESCELWTLADADVSVGDVGNGGGCARVRAESIWEISVPSAQFCSEYKTGL